MVRLLLPRHSSVSCSFNSNLPPLPILLILLVLPSSLFVNSLRCFECFDQNQPCTRQTNCTGSACILYENMLNRTSVAFCLLATAEREDGQMVEGCWRNEEEAGAGRGGGVECLCNSDFCNGPRDLWTSDPNTAPISGLKMLDKNPFVDYEYLDEEKAIQQDERQRNGVDQLNDPEMPAEGEDQDLMPKQFDDYLDWERRTRNRNQTPKEDEPEEENGKKPQQHPTQNSLPPPSSSSIGPDDFENNETSSTSSSPPPSPSSMDNEGIDTGNSSSFASTSSAFRTTPQFRPISVIIISMVGILIAASSTSATLVTTTTLFP